MERIDICGTSSAPAVSADACVKNQQSPLQLIERTSSYAKELMAELRPTSALATILVNELARHAAGMDFAAAAEAATIRFAAGSLEAANLFGSADPSDTCFLTAMSSPLVAAASRYQARHSRAFFHALHELREISASPGGTLDLKLFQNEEDCLAHLARWHQIQPWQCDACGSKDRYFLPSRGRFECTSCHRQISVREGTVFLRSKVPLLSWFHVVVTELADARATMAELAKKVSVVRLGTLRKMRTVVREALNSPAAEQLLAGLPSLVLGHLREVYHAHTAPSSLAQPVHKHAPRALNTAAVNPSVDSPPTRTSPPSPA